MPSGQTGNPNPKTPLAATMDQMTPIEGMNPTAHDSVFCYRSSVTSTRLLTLYSSVLFIVGQGAKAAWLNGQRYSDDARNDLVLSLPLPLESEITQASAEEPYLSMGLRLDASLVRTLLLDTGTPVQPGEHISPAITASPLGEQLQDAASRLLKTLSAPEPDLALTDMYIRELYWLVLRGPQGHNLRALGLGRGSASRVASALERIHHDFAEPISVTALAEGAGMSTTSFHEAFKAATTLSPIQYLKQTRQHQARTLMISNGLAAREAAYKRF